MASFTIIVILERCHLSYFSTQGSSQSRLISF